MDDQQCLAAMNAWPTCTLTMLVVADAIEERSGKLDALTAEALRLLAECGKVGTANAPYYPVLPLRYPLPRPTPGSIPQVWWRAAFNYEAGWTATLSAGEGWLISTDEPEPCNHAVERMALALAYARTSDKNRVEWTRQLRRLVPILQEVVDG